MPYEKKNQKRFKKTKVVTPIVAGMVIAFVLGRKSVKIPPVVFPVTMAYYGDHWYELLMSDGKLWYSQLGFDYPYPAKFLAKNS